MLFEYTISVDSWINLVNQALKLGFQLLSHLFMFFAKNIVYINISDLFGGLLQRIPTFHSYICDESWYFQIIQVVQPPITTNQQGFWLLLTHYHPSNYRYSMI